MFLTDTWYVAALSTEVDAKKPLARTICDSPWFCSEATTASPPRWRIVSIDAGGLQLRRLLKRLMTAQQLRRQSPAPAGTLLDLDEKLQVH